MKSLIIVFFISNILILSQDASRSWFIIQDANDKVVYVDTSNIELTDNQLFVRNIIMYRQPVFMHTLQQNVKKSKSHLLFDVEQKTYSVIGAIFYDVQGEIIGETDDVGVTSGSSNFSLKIQENSVYEVIMNKSLEYLNTNRITVEPSEYLKNKSEEILAELENREENIIEEEEVEEVKTEIPSLPEVVEVPKPIPPVIPKVEEKIKEIPKTKPEPIVEKNIYNASNERALKNLVYTDGNSYCFQVSSWKREEIAKQEVARLNKKGYDAFYVEAEIPNRGNWYRVRVGYFNSLDEAQAVQVNVK